MALIRANTSGGGSGGYQLGDIPLANTVVDYESSKTLDSARNGSVCSISMSNPYIYFNNAIPTVFKEMPYGSDTIYTMQLQGSNDNGNSWTNIGSAVSVHSANYYYVSITNVDFTYEKYRIYFNKTGGSGIRINNLTLVGAYM